MKDWDLPQGIGISRNKLRQVTGFFVRIVVGDVPHRKLFTTTKKKISLEEALVQAKRYRKEILDKYPDKRLQYEAGFSKRQSSGFPGLRKIAYTYKGRHKDAWCASYRDPRTQQFRRRQFPIGARKAAILFLVEQHKLRTGRAIDQELIDRALEE